MVLSFMNRHQSCRVTFQQLMRRTECTSFSGSRSVRQDPLESVGCAVSNICFKQTFQSPPLFAQFLGGHDRAYLDVHIVCSLRSGYEKPRKEIDKSCDFVE
jgi:hypothetical protein